MPTITIARADLTSEEVTGELRAGLGPRYHVVPGLRMPQACLFAAQPNQDPDTILIGRDFGPGTLTTSGYPFIAKQLKRGQSLDQAQEVFRGDVSDVASGALVLRGGDGALEHVLYSRSTSFFEHRYWLAGVGGKGRTLDLPAKINLQGYVDHAMIVSLNEDWPAGPGHGAYKAGDLIAYEPVSGAAELILHPTATQTVDNVAVTRSRVLVELLDNVNGALDIYQRGADGWHARRVDLPKGSAIAFEASDSGSCTSPKMRALVGQAITHAGLRSASGSAVS